MFAAGETLKSLVARTLAIQSVFISRIVKKKRNITFANTVLEELHPAQ